MRVALPTREQMFGSLRLGATETVPQTVRTIVLYGAAACGQPYAGPFAVGSAVGGVLKWQSVQRSPPRQAHACQSVTTIIHVLPRCCDLFTFDV